MRAENGLNCVGDFGEWRGAEANTYNVNTMGAVDLEGSKKMQNNQWMLGLGQNGTCIQPDLEFFTKCYTRFCRSR